MQRGRRKAGPPICRGPSWHISSGRRARLGRARRGRNRCQAVENATMYHVKPPSRRRSGTSGAALWTIG